MSSSVLPSTADLRVAGLLLEDCESLRGSRNKRLLRLHGESLLRRAARLALAAKLSPVVVVLGRDDDCARAELAGLGCEIVVSADHDSPITRSLRTGLASLGPSVDAAIVILTDMLQVSDRVLMRLVERGKCTKAPLVASRCGNLAAPPLLVRRELFNELLASPGERSSRAVLQRHRDRAEFVEWSPVAMMDVDTPAIFRVTERLVRVP